MTDEITGTMKNRSYSVAISELHVRGYRFDHEFVILLAKAGRIGSMKWLQKNGYQIRWKECLDSIQNRIYSRDERYERAVTAVMIRFLENELRKEEMWETWSRYSGENDHETCLEWPPEEVMKDIVEFLQ
jgi:hypothetical protein